MSRANAIRKKVEEKHDIFAEAVMGLGVLDLEKEILRYAKYLEETNSAEKECDAIKQKSEIVSKLKKPFENKIKEYQNKIKQLKKFVDDEICVKELEQQIIKFTQLAELEKLAMADNEELKIANDDLKEEKAPFTESRSALKDKIAYINILIQDKKGGL
jgi:hypothetical protein